MYITCSVAHKIICMGICSELRIVDSRERIFSISHIQVRELVMSQSAKSLWLTIRGRKSFFKYYQHLKISP
jgi:hypothetical protein